MVTLAPSYMTLPTKRQEDDKLLLIQTLPGQAHINVVRLIKRFGLLPDIIDTWPVPGNYVLVILRIQGEISPAFLNALIDAPGYLAHKIMAASPAKTGLFSRLYSPDITEEENV